MFDGVARQPMPRDSVSTCDHMGRITQPIRADTPVVARYDYDAYGNTTKQEGGHHIQPLLGLLFI